MPRVYRTTPEGNHIQSVLIPSDWTYTKRKAYLIRYDYYQSKPDETTNYYRYRQYNPDYSKFIYRTRSVSGGVKLVMAVLKDADIVIGRPRSTHSTGVR